MMVSKNNCFKRIFLATPFLFLFACGTKKELDPESYTKWVENPDNGLCVEKNIGELDFKLIYKPVDYITAYELNNGGIRLNDLPKRKKELEGLEYYTFKIKSETNNEILRSGISSENEYYGRLEYLMDDAQNDMILIEGKDTLPCVLYHFERTYGVSAYNTVVLGFESKDNPDKHTDKLFVYNDKMLGVGKIAIQISGNDIDNAPVCKMN